MDDPPPCFVPKPEFRTLAEMVVDYAERTGRTATDDDELLQLVIAAYRAGRKAGEMRLPFRGYVH